MNEFSKKTKEINVIYFEKKSSVNINSVEDGSIVYLKVKSPLNYGAREWEYYGKIIKKTNDYFYILEYCNCNGYNFNNQKVWWYVDQIKIKEESPSKYSKKWAKKSIIELYLAKTEEKKELHKIYTNCE